MLCQFSVKNYKCIRDEITFDMQAVTITEHSNRVIRDIDDQAFLPVSVIYGPNGGGKSNVLEAMQMLETKVLRPLHAIRQNGESEYKFNRGPVKSFAFSDDAKASPTEFTLFFRTKSVEYKYRLNINADIVQYESLTCIKLETRRKSSLFERKGEEIELKGALSKLKVSEGLSEKLPLLSYLGITYTNHKIIKEVINWFEYGIDFLNSGTPLEEIETAVASSDDVKQLVLDMIREMDLDIVDFRIEQRDEDRLEIFTTHVVDGYFFELSLSEESSGTKKIFGLLLFIALSLTRGSTLVIDELDAKIHPVLLKYIIMLYNDLEINQKGAQLIFTSHDLSTMNNEVFRRDEIWFVAKGNCQNSKLYSLAEFKTGKGEIVCKDAKYDKQYLEGKYGADPYLRKIIDWGVVIND